MLYKRHHGERIALYSVQGGDRSHKHLWLKTCKYRRYDQVQDNGHTFCWPDAYRYLMDVAWAGQSWNCKLNGGFGSVGPTVMSNGSVVRRILVPTQVSNIGNYSSPLREQSVSQLSNELLETATPSLRVQRARNLMSLRMTQPSPAPVSNLVQRLSTVQIRQIGN